MRTREAPARTARARSVQDLAGRARIARALAARTPALRAPSLLRPALFRLPLLVLALIALDPALPAHANPLEARRLLEEARNQTQATWRERVRALQGVLAEASAWDSVYRRTLAELAKVHRTAGHPHAAAALEQWAARLGPRRDRSRLSAVLAQAQALRKEGDLLTAAPLLLEVADAARTIARDRADQALRYYADDLQALGRLEDLERLAKELPARRASSSLRIRVHGAIGMLRLEAEDERGARHALAEAERVHARALKEDDDAEAPRAARAWLALKLRKRLRALAREED